MLRHRHFAREPLEGDESRVYCRGVWSVLRVSDGWWTCQRCGKRLWQTAGRISTVEGEPGSSAPS